LKRWNLDASHFLGSNLTEHLVQYAKELTMTQTNASQKSLADLAQRMRGIAVATLSTHSEGGQIAGRPMSNNGEVDYDGTSYYFAYDQSRTVNDIQRNPTVALAFEGEQFFSLAVEGQAELIRDKGQMKERWASYLERYFKDGLDTPGIVMIKVKATRVHYWDGEEDGEVKLQG
jgi:general stress protein 26